MTSKHVEDGRRTKLTASKKGNTKKKSFQTTGIDEITLPSWSEVTSDDSLNDFIIDKTPVISGKRRLLFDSSDDDDDYQIKPLLSTPVTSRGGKYVTNSRLKRRNTSASPYKSRIITNICDILIPEKSPRKNKTTIVKSNKRSLNKIADKLLENNNITTRAQNRKIFLTHATNKLQEFDKMELNLTSKTLYAATPTRKKDLVAKTPVTSQKIPSSELRRSGRIRKSVGIQRSNCIIFDSNSGFINRIKDEILPLETIKFDKFEEIHKSFKTPMKTPSSSSNKKAKQTLETSKEEAIRQGRALKVVLPNISTAGENKSPPTDDDNLNIKTGVVRLKPKKQKQMVTLLMNQQAVYTVRKGRAAVIINGVESMIEREGEFMVTEGDECSIRNLEERKYLVVHYCIITG